MSQVVAGKWLDLPELRSIVENPLRLLQDAAVLMEVEPLELGDVEQTAIFRAAASQLLIRPSDPVCWSIIRWMLAADASERDYNRMAREARERLQNKLGVVNVSGSGTAGTTGIRLQQ